MIRNMDGDLLICTPTKEHICPCCFDTKEDAYANLDKNVKEGKVVSYKRVNGFVLSLRE